MQPLQRNWGRLEKCVPGSFPGSAPHGKHWHYTGRQPVFQGDDMTERRKDILILTALLLLMVAVFGKILFTAQVVRAPDILNEYFWTVKDIHSEAFTDLFKMDLSNAGWNLLVNSGYTTEGGGASQQFLKYHDLIYWLFPSPANVAWFMVLHLFFGAAGTYLYCRAIGCSRSAAFLGGLVFGYGA